MGLIHKLLGIDNVKIIAKTPEGRKVTYEDMPEGVEDIQSYLCEKVRDAMSKTKANKVSARYRGTTIEVKSW